MAKKCELIGKIPQAGHKVSHANNKVKRRFLPNLRLNVSNSAVRSVDKKGGFDLFIINSKMKNLSFRVKKIKRSLLVKKK